MRSNLFFISEKRFDFIVLKFFCLSFFIAVGFMSATRIFFLSIYFDAVFARIPDAVPISR